MMARYYEAHYKRGNRSGADCALEEPQDPCKTMKLQGYLRPLGGVALALGLSGCITRSIPEYPRSWAPPGATAIGRCPDISGTYVNSGESGESLASFNCMQPTPDQGSGYWSCSLVLTKNMDIPDQISGDVVEIKQPNDESIVVTAIRENARSTPFELSRRHGDFECSNGGVNFSKFGSAVPGGLSVLAAATLQAVYAKNSRSFRRADDGSLVMMVTERVRDWMPWAGIGKTVRAHVRWIANNTSADAR